MLKKILSQLTTVIAITAMAFSLFCYVKINSLVKTDQESTSSSIEERVKRLEKVLDWHATSFDRDYNEINK